MLKRSVCTLAGLLFLAACGGDGGGVTDPDGSGNVQGQVSGPGGGIPGAQVAITGGGSVQTNAEGAFSFTDLEPGAKTVTVTPPSAFVLGSGEAATKTVTVTDGGTATVTWSVRLSDTSPRTVEVGLSSTSFVSSDVTIPVGSTVNWVNQTPITHTISPNEPSKAGTWQDVTISGQGTEFDHTFGTAGTFDYVCKLHAGMTGVVRVH